MSMKANRRMTGRTLARFMHDERGATAIEYAIIAVGIGAAVATTVYSVGSNLNTHFYEKVRDAMTS